MDELSEIIKPSWGAEKWILEGWNKINREEKDLIKTRMHDLFKDGLPFEIRHDKLLYLHTFSLLAQLEVLAIQVPLRFEEKLSQPQLKKMMRTQLLDEIFHGMVFTKIVYSLCDPYALPPVYNQKIEKLCDFIRNEECHKVGIVLLNLVSEAWIEELFISLHNQNIAPKVFSVILQDEHRHLTEADLYREIGIPDKAILRKKLETLEEIFLNSIPLETKYFLAFSQLLGGDATNAFMNALNEKHSSQLEKIDLTPSERWQSFMQMWQEANPRFRTFTEDSYEVEMTPIRKTFMTQWNNPGDPTMVAQFNLDVSCLGFFEKKYPVETLTTVMLQSISHLQGQDALFRSFLSYKKLYQSEHSYLGLVVSLPECGDHMGNIIFKDCHKMTAYELSVKIRRVLRMMVFCYKKREQLEIQYPYLKDSLDALFYDMAHNVYPYPMPGSPIISMSSIGFCGYSQATSPLRKEEALKFTLLTVERRPVWNKATQAFEPRDMLPISLSADHRIFDGSLRIPSGLNSSFQAVFQQMQKNDLKPVRRDMLPHMLMFRKMIDKFLATNLELGYRLLVFLQTMWPDSMDVEEIFIEKSLKSILER